VWLFSSITFAQKSKIDVKYELKQINYENDFVKTLFLVQEISWKKPKGGTWKVKRKNNNLKEWEITENNSKGQVSFVRNVKSTEESTFEWHYKHNKKEVKVIITSAGNTDKYSVLNDYLNLNDPREIIILYEDKQYVLQNGEPDCNSVFYLWEENEYKKYNERYESKEREYLLKLDGKKPCKDTQWHLIVHNSQTPTTLQQIAMFVAVMSQTCRYFYDLKQQNLID
ncbi:MAG: hypothetical protein NZ551_08255, partial [Microscillaceae bacterium]|nr:hypothetical protein [Microscillaceae bacterium]MDW8461190.1 hypothetical protein [Cytophagales bacterium]